MRKNNDCSLAGRRLCIRTIPSVPPWPFLTNPPKLCPYRTSLLSSPSSSKPPIHASVIPSTQPCAGRASKFGRGTCCGGREWRSCECWKEIKSCLTRSSLPVQSESNKLFFFSHGYIITAARCHRLPYKTKSMMSFIILGVFLS